MRPRPATHRHGLGHDGRDVVLAGLGEGRDLEAEVAVVEVHRHGPDADSEEGLAVPPQLRQRRVDVEHIPLHQRARLLVQHQAHLQLIIELLPEVSRRRAASAPLETPQRVAGQTRTTHPLLTWF
jgi:hypothetical protein